MVNKCLDNLVCAIQSAIPVYGDRVLYDKFLESDRNLYTPKNAKRTAAIRTAMFKLPIYLGEVMIAYKLLEKLF